MVALAKTLVADGRMLTPMIGGAPADWEVALDLIAGSFAVTVAQHRPDSVALYLSGQMLTEGSTSPKG